MKGANMWRVGGVGKRVMVASGQEERRGLTIEVITSARKSQQDLFFCINGCGEK